MIKKKYFLLKTVWNLALWETFLIKENFLDQGKIIGICLLKTNASVETIEISVFKSRAKT